MLSVLRSFSGQYINLTDTCKSHLRELLDSTGKGSFLRLGLKQGGCSGLSYSFDIDNEAKPGDEIVRDELSGRQLMRISADSKKNLKGITLDYVDTPFKKYFNIADNPNSEHSCSCGTSFTPSEGDYTKTNCSH